MSLCPSAIPSPCAGAGVNPLPPRLAASSGVSHPPSPTNGNSGLADEPLSGAARRGGRGEGARATRARPLNLTQEDKSAFRAATCKKLNALLENSLREVGRNDLADKVSGCHKAFIGWSCDHGHRWAVPEKSCQVRLCAFEMRARAMRAFHRMKKPLSELRDPRYLVLSERNVAIGQLAEGVVNLFDSFQRLRHTHLWRLVRGAVVVLEITFNRKHRTWHPHLNVIFDGPFLSHSELVRVWRNSTQGRGEVVWIERAEGDGTALEIFKYITKLSDIAADPEAVMNFLAATRKVRFLRTYGSLYRLPVEESFTLSCPDCGSRELSRIGFVPFEAVSLDSSGVLRFDDSFVPAVPPAALGPPVPFVPWPEVEFPLSNPSFAKGGSYESV